MLKATLGPFLPGLDGLCPGRSTKVRAGSHRLCREVGRSFPSLLQASKAQLMLIHPKSKTHQLREDAPGALSLCQALKTTQSILLAVKHVEGTLRFVNQRSLWGSCLFWLLILSNEREAEKHSTETNTQQRQREET